MKNLIFLVIDSLGNKNVDKLGFSPTPFLDELKQKSFYCPNMYSQAPYTEAAVMSMLCGRETMNEGGYFYRFKDAETLFDYFYKENYHIVNYIQPHVYGSSIRRSAQDYFFNVCFDFHVLFSYRLSFYAKKIKTVPLKDYEYKKIITLFDDNFDECEFFYNAILSKDKSASLIQENIDRLYSQEIIQGALESLNKQRVAYKEDKIHYINQVLNLEYEHELFKLPVFDQLQKVDDSTKKWIQQKYKNLFDEIKLKNKAMNKKFRKFSCLQFLFYLQRFVRTRDKEDLKNVVRYPMLFRESFKDPDLMNRIDESYDNFKSAPSIEKHLEHFYKWLDHNKEEPYMACIHVDDIHNPEIFFSYDIEDKGKLEEEFKLCESIVNKVDKTKTGSLTYFLSLAYIDLKVKHFFEELEKRGVLKDTCVVITGDHGFSFDDVVVRPSRVNNFYLENYQVPFLCYGKDIEPHVLKEHCSSKDILPTILDLFHIEKGPYITGESLFNKEYVNNRKIITSEYVGGGCPEMDQREILICAHNEEWLTVAMVSMNEKTDMKFSEIYHLASDPEQRKNLIYKNINDEGLKKVKEVLQKRYDVLYDNYKGWLKGDAQSEVN